jgi:hypothetical protein
MENNPEKQLRERNSSITANDEDVINELLEKDEFLSEVSSILRR